MTQDIQVGKPQRIGPLEVWPLRWNGLSGQKYKTPPFTNELKFSEYDDGDGPRVGSIEVHNLTDSDFIIPSGWVVGAELLQVRSFNGLEYIPAGRAIVADVSCVEKGRWSNGSNRADAGRAPLSVIAAGWDYEVSKREWVLNSSQRQSRVWNQVARQESRSGTRPTSSLEQIMREDAISDPSVQETQRTLRTNLGSHEGQNGVLVGLEGEPLTMEFYSNESAFKEILRETLRSMSFDLEGFSFKALAKSEVQQFIADSALGKMHMLSDDDWALLMAGGNELIDTRAYMARDERFIQVSAINRNHKLLLEV